MSIASLTSSSYATTDPTGWNILESDFNPDSQHHQETVFTIGNGYLGTRGSFEEGYPNDQAATMIHGIFDDAPIVQTELVNCPSWLSLTIRVEGETFRLDRGKILKFDRQLNLKLGLLTRTVQWQSPNGHVFEFRFERFCSLADQHVFAMRVQVTSIDFTGAIEIASGFDPHPTTVSLEHWRTLDRGSSEAMLWLSSQTLHSQMKLGLAAKLTIVNENAVVHAIDTALTTIVQIQPQQTLTVEKIVTVYTSRDVEDPLGAAIRRLETVPSYKTLLAAHISAWAIAWQASDIVIEGDLKAQACVRHNLFQLLIAAPRHDDRVSIPAKTLSGFAYRGHVFWDTEIFIVPFFALTQPNLARNLLTYRYHLLPGARRKAKEAGYEGAMYPWESAHTGDEVTPRWVPGANGEMIRIWCGDIELHITADVAYGAWQYWQVTGDDAWMRDFGAEILFETAKFWASRAEWNSQRQCYEINDVIGPDENHEHVNNNAFTNAMAQWNLRSALSLWDWLQQSFPQTCDRLQQSLNLTVDRFAHWAEVAEHFTVKPDFNTRLIEQFDGFFDLEAVNLDDYEPRTRSMQAILGIEPTNQKQILKQPDVLMMMYLLRQQFDRETLQANWDYYTPRTDHTYGSSLGPAIQAILACELGYVEDAYDHFMRAALVDVEDVRRNAAEGIHAASAGGIWQSIVFGFAGIRFNELAPVAHPNLPAHWTRLKFRLTWRNQAYEFDLTPEASVCTLVTEPYHAQFAPIPATSL